MLFWESVKYAGRGSISRSGAWAPFGGALILWAVLYVSGFDMVIPDHIPGAIAVFLMCAGAAWVLIFIGRLLYAPYHFLKLARAKNCDLEAQLDSRAQRRNLLDRLGALLNRGNQLLVACANEASPPPIADYASWSDETSDFLTQNMGTSFASRFVNPSGLPLNATSIFSGEHRQLWAAVMVRNARLQEFMREFGGVA